MRCMPARSQPPQGHFPIAAQAMEPPSGTIDPGDNQVARLHAAQCFAGAPCSMQPVCAAAQVCYALPELWGQRRAAALAASARLGRAVDDFGMLISFLHACAQRSFLV